LIFRFIAVIRCRFGFFRLHRNWCQLGHFTFFNWLTFRISVSTVCIFGYRLTVCINIMDRLVNETVINSVINNLVLAIIAVDGLVFLFWDEVEYLTRKTRNFITALLITVTVVSGVLYIFKPLLTPNITFLNGLFNK
jgi:heme/copper-type cytochrome/quinol oxidase subunit 4